MDPVVGGFLGAGTMDPAACNDDNIGIFTDIKVIVDKVLQPCLADDHGNVDAFVFCAGSDDNINTGFIGFGDDIDVRSSVAAGSGAVGTDIIGADRQTIKVCYLF